MNVRAKLGTEFSMSFAFALAWHVRICICICFRIQTTTVEFILGLGLGVASTCTQKLGQKSSLDLAMVCCVDSFIVDTGMQVLRWL